jgi:cell division septum initiation protein DivIVA
MFHRADAVLVVDESGAQPHPPASPPAELSHRPDLAGALDGLLTLAPCFRTAVRGYDRLQVDNYVAWAEAEMTAARRETDDLMSRYGHASAELEIARRLLAQSPEGQEMSFASERMGRMLRMAADEAADITGAATAEADRILAEARADADARLRKAHEIKEVALSTGDRIREEAERFRLQAAAELQRAREQADQYLRDAFAQVRREQEAAAAAAAAQVAALQDDVQELLRRREQVRGHLRRLTDQVGEALDALTGNDPIPVPGNDPTPASGERAPNFVVDRAPAPGRV